jgi:hypothetical protein
VNRKRIYQYSTIFLLISCLTVYAVFWNIARKEVYYLCSNFGKGVKQTSVIRQLETAKLSSYVKTDDKLGVNINFSSNVNFSFYQCLIEIDKNKKVIKATFS